jgi:hypothetical protein
LSTTGAKSILDIPKTLEVLESHGVPTIGYRTDYFPAFFTTSSGVKVPMRSDVTVDIAAMIHQQMDILKLSTGMVVGVPNPDPIPNEEEIETLITQTVIDAAEAGITGSAITPHLLSALEKSTGGNSLKSNVSLVLNNAMVAAQIAKDYMAMKARVAKNPSEKNVISYIAAVKDELTSTPIPILDSNEPVPFRIPPRNSSYPPIIVIGGAVVDTISTSTEKLALNTSNPGVTYTAFGGVGRSIAEGIAKLNPQSPGTVSLVSVVAEDTGGLGLLRHSSSIGIDISHMLRIGKDGVIRDFSSQSPMRPTSLTRTIDNIPSTATYTAVHDNDGDLAYGIADMRIFSFLDPTYISRLAGFIRSSRIVIADGNINADTLAEVAGLCVSNAVPLMFEPTSKHKCTLPLTANSLHKVSLQMLIKFRTE